MDVGDHAVKSSMQTSAPEDLSRSTIIETNLRMPLSVLLKEEDQSSYWVRLSAARPEQ